MRGNALLFVLPCALALAGCATAQKVEPARDPVPDINVGRHFWPKGNGFTPFCAVPTNFPESAKCQVTKEPFTVVELVSKSLPRMYRVKFDNGAEGYLSDLDLLQAVPEEAHEAAAAAATECKARGQPRLGMTEKQATASCWGKPDHVDRKIIARGAIDKFVYGNGHYLYFTNGVLTSIKERGEVE